MLIWLGFSARLNIQPGVMFGRMLSPPDAFLVKSVRAACLIWLNNLHQASCLQPPADGNKVMDQSLWMKSDQMGYEGIECSELGVAGHGRAAAMTENDPYQHIPPIFYGLKASVAEDTTHACKLPFLPL